MKTQRSLGALAIALGLALSACSGGGSSHSSPVVPATAAATLPPSSTGPVAFSYGAGTLIGAAPGAAAQLGTMRVNAALRLRNAAGLAQYAAAVSDPTSPLYRHFLTPEQIADQFGATTADLTTAGKYFQSYGLKVASWKQRLALSIVGTQAQMEAAFHTTFVNYATPKGTVYGPKTPPSLPSTVPVTSASHLIDGPSIRFRNYVHVSGSGQNFASGYAPSQIAAAFDYTGAFNAGYTGSGVSVGIIGTGPIDPADFATYAAQFGLNNNVTQVNVGAAGVTGGANGATGTFGTVFGGSPTATPPPVTAPCTTSLPACNPEDGEAQLDVEQVQGLAPNANILFYLAYVPQECLGQTCTPANNYGPLLGISETDDEIQQAINDNAVDVLSLSFGAGEQDSLPYFTDSNNAYTSAGFGPVEFAALAAEGISVFVSSGDAGAQSCSRPAISGFIDDSCVSYPASDVSVTAVGGVTTPLNNAGQFVGPVTGWGQQTSGGAGGASGGGISKYVPKPAFQTGAGVSGTLRNVPDASLDGDNVTGVLLLLDTSFGGPFVSPVGGTSVATPELAAMWALAVQACKQTPSCVSKGTGTHPYRLGNAAPLLYSIYNSSAYATTFLDVTFGNNGVIGCLQDPSSTCPSPQPTPDPGQVAGVGYDRVTGIGVPFARHLISAALGARPTPAPSSAPSAAP